MEEGVGTTLIKIKTGGEGESDIGRVVGFCLNFVVSY